MGRLRRTKGRAEVSWREVEKEGRAAERHHHRAQADWLGPAGEQQQQLSAVAGRMHGGATCAALMK